jgi:hypothetical protein
MEINVHNHDCSSQQLELKAGTSCMKTDRVGVIEGRRAKPFEERLRLCVGRKYHIVAHAHLCPGLVIRR